MRWHLALLAGLWLAALIGFVVIAVFAANHDTFPADLWLAHRIQDLDTAALTHLLDWTAAFADLPLIATVVLVASLALLLTIGREAALLLLLSNAGHLINSGVKEIVARPRPSAGLVHVSGRESDFSFPSGHVESAVVLYGLIFYFATLYVAGAWQRRALQAACVWLIVGTAIQRVYSGAHWPSDVLGGFYLGLLLLAICVAVHRLVILPRKE